MSGSKQSRETVIVNGVPTEVAVLEFNGVKAYMSLTEKTPDGKMKLLETSKLEASSSQQAQMFGRIRVDEVIKNAEAAKQLHREGIDPKAVREATMAGGGMGL